MTLAFTLSMPGCASWNGQWSGSGNCYAICRSFRGRTGIEKAEAILAKGYYSYRWDDGWCAGISVHLVQGSEITKLKRKSQGFCGYDWMVNSILAHGRIATSDDLNKEAARG